MGAEVVMNFPVGAEVVMNLPVGAEQQVPLNQSFIFLKFDIFKHYET